MAGRCRAALVDPPVALTTAQAFSSARRVMMSRGSGPPPSALAHTACMSWRAARRISGARSLNTAGIMLEPMGARQRLAHHAHGVGRELACAGAGRGQAGAAHG